MAGPLSFEDVRHLWQRWRTSLVGMAHIPGEDGVYLFCPLQIRHRIVKNAGGDKKICGNGCTIQLYVLSLHRFSKESENILQ